MPSKKIVSIGLHPDVVDYAMYPGLTSEKLWAGLKAQEAALLQMGFGYTICLVDLGETAEKTARELLSGGGFDAVLIGAGIRLPAVYFGLFEKIVNVVHECAPSAKVCFNTRPDDTVEAFLRWVG